MCMITNYVTIQLNGEPFNCLSLMSLKDMLQYLGIELDLVAIEYNCEIINHDGLSNIFLKTGDKVEILTVVGGG
uniref:Thiamine biosynthesis protein S n=1 Tax=Sporolithon durum TaxID=48970 RepID=A0A141SD46_9FLOR|nr:thiamine biosynthesis protein S [Sporolithon durum]AMK96214.1 thiamine biosynthesis protein S [Sporolithon durum]